MKKNGVTSDALAEKKPNNYILRKEKEGFCKNTIEIMKLRNTAHMLKSNDA